MRSADVCIHAITDGRDTTPKEGIQALAKIQAYIDRVGVGKISTISGRYYAMDRDRRWDRVKKAYDIMTTEDSDRPTFSQRSSRKFLRSRHHR